MKNIVVIGSSNTDMVVKTSHLPAGGETVLGGDFFMNAGGKGANQAVAAARYGNRVVFVAKTGDDLFGKQVRKSLEEDNIVTDYVFVDADHPSGVALITIDREAENCIVVASGANMYLSPADIDVAAEEIRKTRDELCSILAEHSGKPFEKVLADADRDFWMTSQEALEYGMIDNILTGKKRR